MLPKAASTLSISKYRSSTQRAKVSRCLLEKSSGAVSRHQVAQAFVTTEGGVDGGKNCSDTPAQEAEFLCAGKAFNLRTARGM